MTTNTKVINITRKTVRVGTTTVPTLVAGVSTSTTPTVTTIDLEALGHAGRQDLRSLIAQGSLLPSASATSTKISYIALHGRNRARFGATNLPDLTLVTINPTTMNSWQRRDLIQLLASGSLLVGDTASTASVTLYNLTSKTLRFGASTIAPFRVAGSYRASDVITLTNETVGAGFKLTYGVTQGATVFVNGTNTTTAALQTALRTATSDAGLAVTGTANTGPFTVTFSDGFAPSALSVTSGSKVETITLTSFSSTRSFKLTYNAIETAAFVRGTNAAASDLQAALRTATSDAGLLVTGTTDAGPYTVVYSAGFAPLSVLTVTSGTGGVTGVVAEAPLTGAVVATGSVPAAAQVTDVTAMTVAQRYDLQTLLASGQLLAKA